MNNSKFLVLGFLGATFSLSAMDFDKSAIKKSDKIEDKSEKKDDELYKKFVSLTALYKKRTRLQRELNDKYPSNEGTSLCVYTVSDRMRDEEGQKITEVNKEIQGILAELENS